MKDDRTSAPIIAKPDLPLTCTEHTPNRGPQRREMFDGPESRRCMCRPSTILLSKQGSEGLLKSWMCKSIVSIRHRSARIIPSTANAVSTPAFSVGQKRDQEMGQGAPVKSKPQIDLGDGLGFWRLLCWGILSSSEAEKSLSGHLTVA
jgi:hypothetical protein